MEWGAKCSCWVPSLQADLSLFFLSTFLSAALCLALSISIMEVMPLCREIPSCKPG